MSERKDSIPLSGEPDKERKQQNPLPPGETPERPDLLATIYKPHVRGDKFSWWDVVHSKRAWTVLVVLLFLSYFFTAIPVEKVPLLRNLAYVMGFTREETKTFSFLKTLLTFPQHYKAHRAEKEDWERTRKSSAAAIAASTEDALLYKAQLINFKQSSQGANPQGQDSDELHKVRQANTARDSRVVALASVLRDDPAATQTAQKTAGSEVFFGTQEGIIPRDPTAGFDTTQNLSDLPSPGVVDSHKTDKLLEAAESFYARTTNIDFQNKLTEHTIGSRTMLQDLSSPDDKKPRVDVVYAWLTSRAAKRTENKMLKKTLAAAGFLGADLTRPMLLTALDGTGTMAVDPRQIDVDISVAKERVEREEKCTNYLTDGAYQSEIIEFWQNTINGDNGYLKKVWNSMDNLLNATCDTYQDKISVFNNNMNDLSDKCQTLNSSYGTVQTACQITVKSGKCDNSSIRNDFTNLKGNIDTWCSQYTCQQTNNPNQYKDGAGNIYETRDACETACEPMRRKKVTEMGVNIPNYLNGEEAFITQLKTGDGNFFPGMDSNDVNSMLYGRIGKDWETNQN